MTMVRSYWGVFILLLASGCLPGDEQTQHDSGQEDARTVPPCMEITIRVDKRVLRCVDTEGDADVADPNQTNDARATSNVAPVLQCSLLEHVEAVEYVHRIIAQKFGEDGNCVVDSHTSAITMIPNSIPRSRPPWHLPFPTRRSIRPCPLFSATFPTTLARVTRGFTQPSATPSAPRSGSGTTASIPTNRTNWSSVTRDKSPHAELPSFGRRARMYGVASWGCVSRKLINNEE